MKMAKQKWTYEKTIEFASKFNTKKELSSASSSAYQAILRNNWQEAFSHMKTDTRRKYTTEVCMELAKQFKHKSDFKKEYPSAYSAVLKNNWEKYIFANMIPKNRPKQKENPSIWSKKVITQKAKQCKSLNEFYTSCGGAINAAIRYNWWDDIREEFFPTENPYDTLDKLKSIASKYQTIKEFRTKESAAYYAAHKNALWPEIKKLLSASKYNANKNCVYAIVNNSQNLAYIGITCQSFTKRMEQHKRQSNSTNSKEITTLSGTEYIQLTEYIYSADEIKNGVEQEYYEKFKGLGYKMLNSESHLGTGGTGQITWTEKKIRKTAKQFSKRSAFIKNANGAYIQAKKLGILDSIYKNMDHPPKKWSFEECYTEACKYKTRNDFKEHSPSAWQKANKMNWLNEICKDYTGKYDQWNTIDKCRKEAATYSSRTEFQKSAPGCYQRARNAGWLEEICSHMKSVNRTRWTEEKIWEHVKRLKSYSEFNIKGSKSPLYKAAYRRGMISDIKEFLNK